MRTRDCPNIKRIIRPVQPHQPLGGVGNSARHRHAQIRLSVLKRFIELAHCCRDVQNLHAHVRRLRRPQPVGRAALKGLWEKLPTKWEKRYAELDQLCNPKSNSAAMRCCAASTK